MPTLYLICGLPGAGKTTWAKHLEAEHSAIRFCPDAWIKALMHEGTDEGERDRLQPLVEALQWSTAQTFLKRGVSVILENGFWSREERDRYRDEARESGAKVELHYLEVPVEELWRRIEQRNADLPDDSFPIAREEFLSWLPLFTPPDADEGRLYDRFVSAELLS